MNALSTSLLITLCAVAIAHRTAFAGDRINGSPIATRSEVIAKHGIAATSHPLATQIALDILKQGGTAVDAAIAANAALGLMEPTGAGIGGDLFAIVWDAKTKKLHALNASGRSPYALTIDTLRKDGARSIPPYGPLPVTVPGCVDGWFALHKRFGKLDMSTILAPAITYAWEGFPLTEVIAHYWSFGPKKYADRPNFIATFAPGGKAPKEGDIFKNPDLAKTYQTIAKQGREAFYNGVLSEKMVSYCKRTGCYLRANDFADHQSTWVDPVSTNYRGYDVWEIPPNGQGIAALQILNLIEPYNLTTMGHNSAEYLHLLVEAKKIAYEDRAKYYADPSMTTVPVAKLISKDYAAKRRKLFDPRHASTSIPHGHAILRQGDTVYLTVADKDRNMVSLIQSNYRGFGSGLVPDGLGFVFQDRGQLFSLEDNHPNRYEPHKRPFHTIIPGFVTKNGKPLMSFGVMGGDMQPQGHVQVLCNMIDFDMNLQVAGDAARFHHHGSSEPTGGTMIDGGTLALESAIGSDVRSTLKKMGHRVVNERGGYGGYQAIFYDEKRDIYRAASESRKDGNAAGY